MFKIREFSRMSGLSVDTLYHYDSIGVLHPAYIDKTTGYRFYEANQLVTISKILAFKDAGFSLQEISDILNKNLSVNLLIDILEKKAVTMEEELEAKASRLERLHTNIFMIKNGGIPRMDEISVKKVEPILVASLRRTFLKNGSQTYDEFCEEMWANVNKHIDKMKGKRMVPCMTLYHKDNETEQDMEVIEPLTKEIPSGEEVRIYQLPAIERSVCIVHNGPFSTIPQTYHTAYKWIAENGYTLNGATREIYHKGDWATDNPEEYVTELQFPIQ